MPAAAKQQIPWARVFGAGIRWALALLFLFNTLKHAWAGRSLITLMLGAVIVTLTLPPGYAWARSKFRRLPNGWTLVGLIVALLFTQIFISEGAIERRAAQSASDAQKATLEEARRARAETLAYFEKNKPAVLTDITNKAAAGQLQDSLDLATKYTAVSRDPDLARSRRIVAAMMAKADLKNEAFMTPEKQLEAYKALAEFEPDDKDYVRRAAELQADFDKRLVAEQEKRERDQRLAARAETIKAQFSAWDGSHRNLEQLLKADMKNPSSYEHVSTRFIDKGDKVLVFTTIRGTNSFNAVVPSSFVAEIDMQGNVLSINRSN